MRGSRLAANLLSVESRRIWLSVARSSVQITAISLLDTDESAPDEPSRLEAPVAVLRPLAGTEDFVVSDRFGVFAGDTALSRL